MVGRAGTLAPSTGVRNWTVRGPRRGSVVGEGVTGTGVEVGVADGGGVKRGRPAATGEGSVPGPAIGDAMGDAAGLTPTTGWPGVTPPATVGLTTAGGAMPSGVAVRLADGAGVLVGEDSTVIPSPLKRPVERA